MASVLSGICRGRVQNLLHLILRPENFPKLVVIQTVVKAEVLPRSYILICHQDITPLQIH